MQIGGPNELYNLWPLVKGENRSSGTLLKNEIERSKATLKASKKKKADKDDFKLLIVKTRVA